MFKNKSMNFLIIGMVCTGIGIVFTAIGTYMQNKGTESFQNSIIVLSKENFEISEELRKNESINHEEVKILHEKNAELSKKLLTKTEEYNLELTRPSVNVIMVEEKVTDESLYFEVSVKNSGISDISNLTLIIDDHSNPMYPFLIEDCKFFPRSYEKKFTIPVFDQKLYDACLALGMKEHDNKILNEFIIPITNNRASIKVIYHFDYEWNNEKFSTNQYVIMKIPGFPIISHIIQ